MYRLLIADDEALEREGLELIVKKGLPGLFEIFHAKNGREAIEHVEEYKPDIILMDIKMPGIDGLEALKKIQQINWNTKMVLVTAYDYFSYAKEAVSIGVKDYILKPAKREHVIDILKQLISQLKQEKEKRRESLLMQEKLSELLPFVESEMAMMLMVDQVQEIDLKRLAEIINFKMEKGYAIVIAFALEPVSSEKKRVFEGIKNFMKGIHSCIVGPIIGNQMVIFIKADTIEQPYSGRIVAIERAEKLDEFIAEKFGLTVSLGIGSIQKELQGLRRSYHEAELALARKNVKVNVRHYEDILLNPQLDGFSIKEELVKGNKTLSVIEHAEAFILEKYREDISLEQTAEHVNLSSYYFSKTFKNEYGKTFIDYLTDIRIQKAKELMEETNLSLKEICYEVGYKDPNYFSRVFKKVTGITPKDYRQRFSI
ncbi:response regulator [Neobacillus cucumis]|uniref:response regulator n=1 Tax=Neobacillus cucumis TaxID=1740721 RepID=UPI002E228EB9|nr:AraC family transcriptional regulator [Neobacillus cucumis]MED4225499.1 AraC family transcriptional regulator [Neobacillus cucumis]